MKNHFKSIVGIGFLFSILLFNQSCGNKTQESTKTSSTQMDPIPVRVMNLDFTGTQDPIQVSGKFTTLDETNLSFKVGGLIREIRVNEGDRVKKGEILASIKTEEIDARVGQNKLSLSKAERDFERATRLFRDSVITREQLENLKTTRDLAAEQLKSAQFDLNYSTIKAISDGYVLKKFATPGQLVNSGAPILQVNGAHHSNWVLQASVSDAEWAQVRIGDKAQIQTDIHSQILTGELIRKSQNIDPGTGSFLVDIEIQGNTSNLAAGMFGKAILKTKISSKNWKVPYESILDAGGNQAFIFIVDDHHKAKRISVHIQSFDQNSVWIDSGLDSVHQIIVGGSAYLSDGSPISIIQ